MTYRCTGMALAAIGLCASAPASAQSAQAARDLIFQSAFGQQSQPVALERVRRAQAIASAVAARDPANEDAAVLAAAAQGYVAKLTASKGDALKARKQFDAVVSRFPNNAEAQLGIGAWHLAIIHRVGRIFGAVVGANRGRGMDGLTRAVQLSQNHAFVTGVAGLMLIEADPSDRQGRAWVEAAVRGTTPTGPDRAMQQAAGRVLALLRAGDTKGAQAAADRLLPFGWFKPD